MKPSIQSIQNGTDAASRCAWGDVTGPGCWSVRTFHMVGVCLGKCQSGRQPVRLLLACKPTARAPLYANVACRP